jgi:hypothetical protein
MEPRPPWEVKSNFFIGVVGGGVQLGPLGTAATNMPSVSARSDYDDAEIGEMMIGRGNRSTQRILFLRLHSIW